MSYVISRADLCMSDPMPFSQHWEARISTPIDSIEDMGLALREAFTVLKAGDLVNIASFDDNLWKQMMECASFRVVSIVDRKINMLQVSDTVKLAPARDAISAAYQPKLKVVKVRSAYEVHDEHDNVLDCFVDEKQADTFIEHYGKPVKSEDEGKGDIALSGLTLHKGFAGKQIVKNQKGEVVKEFKNKALAERFIEQHGNAN